MFSVCHRMYPFFQNAGGGTFFCIINESNGNDNMIRVALLAYTPRLFSLSGFYGMI